MARVRVRKLTLRRSYFLFSLLGDLVADSCIMKGLIEYRAVRVLYGVGGQGIENYRVGKVMCRAPAVGNRVRCNEYERSLNKEARGGRCV